MGKQSRRKRQIPPIPPGVDRLRNAGSAIDRDAVYQLMMPDGTLFVASGASLLETADAAVDVADAIGTGEAGQVLAAFERLTASSPSSMVVCTRIGKTRGLAIPPGYLTADCHRCRQTVWISPGNHRLVASGARPICSDCLDP